MVVTYIALLLRSLSRSNLWGVLKTKSDFYFKNILNDRTLSSTAETLVKVVLVL